MSCSRPVDRAERQVVGEGADHEGRRQRKADAKASPAAAKSRHVTGHPMGRIWIKDRAIAMRLFTCSQSHR